MTISKTEEEIQLYQSKDGQISFNVNVFDETVWLSQKQMAQLFDKDRRTITEHIGNIFREGELDEKLVCRNFQHTTQHGAIKGQTQNVLVKYYNLDVIISVGYRVKSARGTQFRIWATQILKSYMINGYAINEKRLKNIEEKINNLSIELRAEFKKEINQINQNLLEIVKKPINIYNQIGLTNNQELESKITKLLDQLIDQSQSDLDTKNQLEEVKNIIKKSVKDKESINKISQFLEQIGDEKSKIRKIFRGIGITNKLIKELVSLSKKLISLL